MSSSTETRTVVEQIVDNADERELWIVGREFERPPYFHAGKGGDTRLARALRVCVEGRITPNSDGSYTVEGSEHRTYRVAESCSCPNSQKASTKWCYHMVSVAVYVEWQRRIRNAAPVELGTLRAGTWEGKGGRNQGVREDGDEEGSKGIGRKERGGNPNPTPAPSLPSPAPSLPSPALPLPPTTVDERLAQAATHAAAHVFDALPTPQEDRMPDDEYSPEPETYDTTTAVVEPPDTTASTPRPLPGPHLLPSLDARALEQSMQAYAAQRAVVTRYIKEQMTEGVDYYTLTVRGRVSKATLSKAGSEKFLSLFQLVAQFQQDHATWQMLGSKDGLLCYTCHLLTRSGEVVGEGRGARNVAQDGGDINKAIKMACKSSQVDAVLRTGALSDVFTQDLDDAPDAVPARETPPARPTSQDLRQRIWTMVQAQAPHVTTREAVEAWVQERTGMPLHPDFYPAIVNRLEGHA